MYLFSFLVLVILTACTSGTEDITDIVFGSQSTEPDSQIIGWSEESHSDEAEPNYEVVFPESKVNQITITIEPEDWTAMQENMVALFGEAGTGGQGRGFPGEGGPDGRQPPEGFEPPQSGDRPERLWR